MELLKTIEKYLLTEKVNISPNLRVFAHQIKIFSMHLEKEIINDDIHAAKSSITIIEDNLKNLKRKL